MLNLFYNYKLNDSEKQILIQEITFYKNLSFKDKKKFEYRVARFISEHNFISREDVVITDELKVFVSAIAIMLTFKMRNYLFDHFKNIIIYPKNYFSTITKSIHKGETNPRIKTIVFSWKDFVEGVKIEDDNLNLGIHEFTHALFFSFLKKKSFEAFRFMRNYKKMMRFLNKKEEKQKLLNAKYFRPYAYENQYEFLAVVTENYFETPNVFKERLPKLFWHINKLYKIY